MWHEDRFRPLTTALVNLVLNLILVQFIGIYGVLLSTVISTLVIGMPWIIHNLFTVIFHRTTKEFILNLLFYIIISTISVGVSYFVCEQLPLDGILIIIVRLIICCCIPNFIYLIAYKKTEEFEEAIQVVDRMCGNRFGSLHKILNKL